MRKILIVDDASININILVDLLSDNNDIIVATDGLSAINVLKRENIDLVLLDIMMPGIDGFEVCKKIKSNIRTKHIPIIFITAKTDECSIEKAYEIGGSDYVTKPFKPRELLAKINREFQLQDMIKHLEFISSYDQMTGILNRRKFFELAEDIFHNSKSTLYAIMIDIDKFKDINDNFGHPFGDKVLKEVSKTIDCHLKYDAIFARLGGEEFAILVNLPEDMDVKTYIKKIGHFVQEQTIISEDNKKVKVTISQGIAQKDYSTKNIDQLLKKADDALYEAKGSGRNKVIFRV